MFAVPENTVLRPSSPYRMSPTGLVRWVESTGWRDMLSAASPAVAPLPLPLPCDDPAVRVWLSLLPPGSADTPHRYDAAQGAFAVLSGAVVEHAGGTARILRPGQVRVFGPGYRHTVRNAGTEPAVTVHVQVVQSAAPRVWAGE